MSKKPDLRVVKDEPPQTESVITPANLIKGAIGVGICATVGEAVAADTALGALNAGGSAIGGAAALYFFSKIADNPNKG